MAKATTQFTTRNKSFVPCIQSSDLHVKDEHTHEGEGHKNRSNTNRNSVSRWLNKMILLDHFLDTARCVRWTASLSYSTACDRTSNSVVSNGKSGAESSARKIVSCVPAVGREAKSLDDRA